MRILASVAVIVLLGSVCTSQEPREGASEEPPRRPNIVFILADDLGYGDLGCYGQDKIKTPAIDRLASQGMLFRQHYSGSPVCAPSRCTLLTGLHTGHAYIRDNKGTPRVGQLALARNTVTLPRLLQQSGYRTVGIGKWGLGGPITTGHPLRQGFDYWFGYLDDWAAHDYYPESLYRDHDKVQLPENFSGAQGLYSHDCFTQEALDALGPDSREKPLFLYFATTIPHVSLQVPSDSIRPYRGRFPETPFPGDHYAAHPTPRAAYAAMISRLDRDVGRILERLDQLKMAGNTIVFFASDNGPTTRGGADPAFFRSSGPWRGRKGELFEGGIRVPLLVRWPGHIAPGTETSHPCAFWDILPTILDLTRTPPASGIDGISFAPTLLGRPDQQRTHDFFYWEHAQSQQAVRRGPWKAIRLRADRPIELYHLLRDPGEKKNIADQEPRIVAELNALLISARTPSRHFPFPLDRQSRKANRSHQPKKAQPKKTGGG